jgi:hypothetical protein
MPSLYLFSLSHYFAADSKSEPMEKPMISDMTDQKHCAIQRPKNNCAIDSFSEHKTHVLI